WSAAWGLCARGFLVRPWRTGPTAAWATLWRDLVHQLIDARIRVGLRRSGINPVQLIVGGSLVDVLVRSVLQRGGDVVCGLAMRLGHLRQRLARQLSLQLLGRNAYGLGSNLEVGAAAEATLWPWATPAAGQAAVRRQALLLANLGNVLLERLRGHA